VRHHIRIAYWASFAEFLKAKGSNFRIRRSNKDHWFEFPIGRAGFTISATISIDKKRIGVELYNHNDANKTAFRALSKDKEQIEKDFGEALEWQELPGKKATRIAIFKYDTDPADETQRDAQHNWMLAKMDRFRAVFASRVKALTLNTVIDDSTTEEDQDD
jgi:hypothetical protein